MRTIKPGDVFEVRHARGHVSTFRRETDDPAPTFECERIRVTHIGCSLLSAMKPYTFGTEPEWFAQRGLVAS
jgi:hypothetical protein